MPPKIEPPDNYGLEQCGLRICISDRTVFYVTDLEKRMKVLEAAPCWANSP